MGNVMVEAIRNASKSAVAEGALIEGVFYLTSGNTTVGVSSKTGGVKVFWGDIERPVIWTGESGHFHRTMDKTPGILDDLLELAEESL